MNLKSITLMFSVILNFGFGVFVVVKNKKSLINWSYAIFLLCLSLWSFALAMFYHVSTDSSSVFWANAIYFMGSSIAVAFFYFSSVFPTGKNPSWKRMSMPLSGLFLLFILYFSTSEMIKGIEYRNGVKTFIYGNCHFAFDIHFILLFGLAFWKLYCDVRTLTLQKKEQAKYLLLSTAIGVIFNGQTNIIMPSIFHNCSLVWVGPHITFVMVCIMTYAILKYRLMDIRIIFSRAGIFLVVYGIVLGIPFIVLHRTGSGLLATSLAVVFASTGPILYRFLQRKAEAIVLAKQLNYQRILLQAATTMIVEHDLLKLSRLIVYILKKTIKLKFSAIFVKNRGQKTYLLKAMRGAISTQARDAILNQEHPFISYLKENKEPFLSEEMPLQIKDSLNLPLELKTVIPAFAGDELLAFVLLGDKVNAEPYTQEDIDVFKILARQATLAIQNCEFFEESKDYQQRVFSAEKLASLGGMADGIAHQIKNRLNLFSLAGGELKNEIKSFMAKHDKLINTNPELDKTFKYLNEIAASIIDNVKRTDGVIKGILDFAKVDNKENLFTTFSFKGIVELSSRLLMIKHEVDSLPISVKIDTKDTIYAAKSQLTEVIYNLMDNAYEAIKEKEGRISEKELESFFPVIQFSLTYTQDRQIIKISDNGIGIKEEDKPKIFAPFFTTKASYKSGSGIGAYVLKRIIEENHKGKIWFTSTYMKGTSFIIELPKKPTGETRRA